MNCINRVTLPVCLLLIVFGASCAGRPDGQISETQAAMEEARQARAPEFAKGDWDHAMDAWTEAQELLNRNDFSKARTSLLTAKSRFEKAGEISRSHREQFRIEAENMLGTIEARYKRLAEEMKSVRLRPQARKELEEMGREITDGIEKIGTLLKEERFMEARDGSQEIVRKVYDAELKMQGSK